MSTTWRSEALLLVRGGDRRVIRAARRLQGRDANFFASCSGIAFAKFSEASLESFLFSSWCRRESDDDHGGKFVACPHRLDRRTSFDLAEFSELRIVDQRALGFVADDFLEGLYGTRGLGEGEVSELERPFGNDFFDELGIVGMIARECLALATSEVRRALADDVVLLAACSRDVGLADDLDVVLASVVEECSERQDAEMGFVRVDERVGIRARRLIRAFSSGPTVLLGGHGDELVDVRLRLGSASNAVFFENENANGVSGTSMRCGEAQGTGKGGSGSKEAEIVLSHRETS
jgi:hypothetical protein